MPFSLPNYSSPNTGAPANYFVVTTIVVNVLKQSIIVGVSGYVNQSEYAKNLQPIATEDFMIIGDIYTQFLTSLTSSDIPSGTQQAVLLQELIGALHINMLTLPFFSGATIVT
jgi:hypothetical protein